MFGASQNPFWLGASWKQAILARKSSVVVQFHGGFIPRFFAAARFLQQHDIPYLVTPHGNYNTHALQRNRLVKQVYFNLFERQLLAGAGAVHVLGQSEMTGLHTLYPNQKSVLIPYGFSPSELTAAPVDTTFIVGFCGRLDMEHKGLDSLIDGFAAFHKYVPDARLWLIGDGPHQQLLKKMVEQRGLTKWVAFWGSRLGEEKLELLGLCSVFVHSSRYEGLPASVLEAASLGLPCLVSEATNMGDAVRMFNAGHVIQHGTAEQVTEGLRILQQKWQRGTLTQLGQNARHMVEEAYNWPRQLEQFSKLYEQVWQPN